MGAAEELTGAQHKAGHGLTQWQLLRLARKAQPENGQTAAQVRAFYAARWWEVMKAVKGRSQLFKSEGFKALAAEYLDANPEDAAPEPETVLSFGTREKGGEQTRLWCLAAPSLLAVKEAAERIPILRPRPRPSATASIRAVSRRMPTLSGRLMMTRIYSMKTNLTARG